jgi:hypothetical protein
LVAGAFAELFTLSGVPMPVNRSLAAYHVFHVYAHHFAPTATVTFRNFEIKWSNGEGMRNYDSLQVSLIPWSKFQRLIHADSFCQCNKLTVATPITNQEIPIYSPTSNKDATFQITETDAYCLTITNCGDRAGATITKGDIIVKQKHGALPANKIWTLQWLGLFTLVTALICIRWVIALARHYKALVYVQKVIGACAMTAFLEAASQYLLYKDWNASGTPSRPLMAVAEAFYCLKYVLTLRMLIETASGSGITMQRLEAGVQMKMTLVCFFCFVLQWIWKLALSYQQMPSSAYLVAVSIPGTLLWLVLFIWLHRKFLALSETLQEKKLASEAVSLFINTRFVLLASLLLATEVLMIQLADILLSATPWELQWVPYDAAPHSVYTLFLLAFMILWWPHADSWKLGYSDEVKQEENATGVDGRTPAWQIGVPEAAEI